MATGIGTALAGGSSDTSGDGYHCYLFFSLPDGQFAQAMVNDSYSSEVMKKVDEFIEKYEYVEDGTLDLAIGNLEGCQVEGECSSDRDCASGYECEASQCLLQSQ